MRLRFMGSHAPLDAPAPPVLHRPQNLPFDAVLASLEACARGGICYEVREACRAGSHPRAGVRAGEIRQEP